MDERSRKSQICLLLAVLLHYFWLGRSSSPGGLILSFTSLRLVQLWFCTPSSQHPVLVQQQPWDMQLAGMLEEVLGRHKLQGQP